MYELWKWNPPSTGQQAYLPVNSVTLGPKPRYDVVIYFRDGDKTLLQDVEISPSNDFLTFENDTNIWGFNRQSIRSLCMTKKKVDTEDSSDV